MSDTRTEPQTAALRDALNEAARDAHALTVRLAKHPACSGAFETCPSPYCTLYRAALRDTPESPVAARCEECGGSTDGLVGLGLGEDV